MKKSSWNQLLLFLLFPLAVGALASLLTVSAMESFSQLPKPRFSPPAWLFPVVWTLLYLLMGFSSYLVLNSEQSTARARHLYLLQLVFNFFWPILFFRLQLYFPAFIWLVLLWLLIYAATEEFYQIKKEGAYLLLPYLLWVTFAGYLNFAVWQLQSKP